MKTCTREQFLDSQGKHFVLRIELRFLDLAISCRALANKGKFRPAAYLDAPQGLEAIWAYRIALRRSA
jgi:hypothetical protein